MASQENGTKLGRPAPTCRLNTSIRGEPARIVEELKRRGIVRSNTDAFVQGVYALYKNVVERDLALARLRTLSAHDSEQ
jgi:hypothetical protein